MEPLQLGNPRDAPVLGVETMIVACYLGLLSIDLRLFWGIVACTVPEDVVVSTTEGLWMRVPRQTKNHGEVGVWHSHGWATSPPLVSSGPEPALQHLRCLNP